MTEVLLRYEDNTFDIITWTCERFGPAGKEKPWDCGAIFVRGEIHMSFVFQEAKDAMLFKLTWGGK